MLPENYSQHLVVYIRNRNVFGIFHIQDYISLQPPRQIFVNRPVWLESSIPRSLAFDIQIHFIYLMCHTALLLLIFITFCVLNNIVSYDQSKRVIKVDEFDHSRFWEGRNVDILIFSKKIKLCSQDIIRSTTLFIFQIEMFLFASISKDYISLQTPRQIFVNRPAWLGLLISHSLASDVQIHFIGMMCHTALLFLIFTTLCVLNNIVSYDQSRRVTKVGAFNHRWDFCEEPKFSFNRDRRSMSYFKIFSSSQKLTAYSCVYRNPKHVSVIQVVQ
jgi:hypothetical protein